MDKLTKFAVILILGLDSCSETMRLDSDQFNTIEARIEILKEEVHFFSDVQDAEFELFNVNGFKSQGQPLIPGPSSLDYKFAVKVDTADVNGWTAGMVKFDPENYDDSWTREIIRERSVNWNTTGEPIYFKREAEDVKLVLFQEDGIIFKRIISN